MMTILTFLFKLVFFLSISISGNPSNLLDNMAASGKTINGFLRPVLNGSFAHGTYGFLFKGEMVRNNRSVAMKFVKKEHKNTADREFEMYSYLDAIDKPKIEKFGISAIYYYNEWNDYMVMAFSHFYGGTLEGKKYIDTPIDSLILFKQFVLQAKYLHSHGVRHDDIKPENIMLLRGRSYLIDFNNSAKLAEFSTGGTLQFSSRASHNGEIRCAMDDFESFLYTMCYLNSLELKWFDTIECGNQYDSDVIDECGDFKQLTDHTLKEIESIESVPLRHVFEAFANEVFNNYDKQFPDYDRLDKVITASIKDLNGSTEVPLFTWLTDQEIQDARLDPPVPDIEHDLKDPSKIEIFKYDKPDYTYFHQLKKIKSFGSASSSPGSSKRKKKMI